MCAVYVKIAADINYEIIDSNPERFITEMMILLILRP